MYVLGHVGVTLTAARAVDPGIDWRAPAFLAMLPDLLDKPVSRIWPHVVHHNTRGFGHTLLAWLVVAAVLALLRRPLTLKRPWLLWACFAGHAVLDRLWVGQNQAVFLWPLLGRLPPPLHGGPAEYHAYVYNVVGELVGLALLLRLAQKRRAGA